MFNRGFVPISITIAQIASALVASMLLVVPASGADKDDCTQYNSDVAAINACTRAISSRTFRGRDLIELHQARAEKYHDVKQYDRAIADWDEVIKLAGSTASDLRDGYYYRARTRLAQKQFDRVIADMNEALRHGPNDDNSHYQRGEGYFGKGEWERAIADFSETIRINPKDQLAWKYRTLSRERKGEFDQALADIRTSIELDKARGYSASTEMEIAERIEGKIEAYKAGFAAGQAAAAHGTAQPFADSPRNESTVSRGWLGVEIMAVDAERAHALDLKTPQGALVVRPIAGGPADAAGIRVNDVITMINDSSIKDIEDLPRLIGALAPGTSVQLSIMRTGQVMNLRLALGARPDSPPAPPVAATPTPPLVPAPSVAAAPLQPAMANPLERAQKAMDLGYALALGQGVQTDPVKAYRSFDLAVTLFPAGPDRESAVQARNMVQGMMTPEQLAEARKTP